MQGAAFCARCGLQVSGMQPIPAHSQVPMPVAPIPIAPIKGNRKSMIAAIIMILVFLGIIYAGLRASGLLQFGRGGTPETLSATKKGTTPVLDQIVEKPPGMPAEVFDWLKHLEATEKQKQDLNARQTAQFTSYATMLSVAGAGISTLEPDGSIEDPGGGDSPEAHTAKKLEDFRPAWREVQNFFHTKTPPEECAAMATAYDQALYEITGIAGDLQELLEGMQQDPTSALEKAQSMRGKSYEKVDVPLAKTDDLVGQICGKYGVNRWFSIQHDLNSGTLGVIGGGSPTGR